MLSMIPSLTAVKWVYDHQPAKRCQTFREVPNDNLHHLKHDTR